MDSGQCLGGVVFYCHKGVPLAAGDDPPDHTHMHPKKPNGEYDREKMRECAGWLNQRLRAIYKPDRRSPRDWPRSGRGAARTRPCSTS